MSSGLANIIGSNERRSVAGDPMIWANPRDVILYARSSYYHNMFIPDKKRNTPLRTVQLSGRSQVIGQLVYISAKVRQVLLRYTSLQSGVKSVFKKIGHEPCGGQIVKSQEISVFIMLSCWISSSNGNQLSRPNYTQTLILCKFDLKIHHTRKLNAR